jgi:hypothetical protein
VRHDGFARWGGLASIVFAVLAIVGLAMWFTGAGSPEGYDDIAGLTEKLEDADRAVTGAWVLIVAMVWLVVYAVFLIARWGRESGVMLAGAVLLMFAGLVHIVENLLVVGLYSTTFKEGGTSPAAESLWVSISSCSVLAFGLIGAGSLAIGYSHLSELGGPRWLGWWAVATGLLGLGASLSLLFPPVSFLPAPMNLSALALLIAIGVRTFRQREDGAPLSGESVRPAA